MASEIKATFDGIPFKVKFDHGRQIACYPVCPKCDNVLERREEPEEDSLLICSSKNLGCPDPVKRFDTAEEMDQFLTKASQKFDKLTG